MRRRFYYEYTWDYYRKQAQDRTKERFIVLRNGERIPMQDWIKEGVPWERKQKLPLNMELLAVCTADVIDYKRAEELLQKGAEPLGYIEEGGWPDNLYTSVVWHLYKGSAGRMNTGRWGIGPQGFAFCAREAWEKLPRRSAQ